MQVAFLGLGLIGGSVARALHDAPAGAWTACAWTPDGRGPRLALEAGAIDQAAPTVEAALDGADIVVLAAPPTACLSLIEQLGGSLRRCLSPATVITDVASTKTAIVNRADGLGLRFVGGHPMAGRETGGFAAADPALFDGRPWVLVPPAGDMVALDRVAAMVDACHAHVVPMDALTHDALVAGISHMPLIVAAALVEAVAGTASSPRGDWPDAAALAAGGWAGMTRLARGDATMGAGIAATNAPAIADRLRDVRRVIDEWLAVLDAPEGPDEAVIRDRLAAARATLEEAG